jgi:hypothetical protein
LCKAPHDSGMCWKQFMMYLEGTWFVAALHSTPMHDPGPEEFQRPARECVRKGASVLPCLLSCCCWLRRPPAVRRSRLRTNEVCVLPTRRVGEAAIRLERRAAKQNGCPLRRCRPAARFVARSAAGYRPLPDGPIAVVSVGECREEKTNPVGKRSSRSPLRKHIPHP